MGIGDIQKKIHWLVYEKGKLLVDWALHGEIWVWIPTQKQNEIKMMNQRNKLLCIVYAYFLEMEVYKFTQKKKKRKILSLHKFLYVWLGESYCQGTYAWKLQYEILYCRSTTLDGDQLLPFVIFLW